MRSVSTESYAARSRCAAFSLLLPRTTAITRPFSLAPHARFSDNILMSYSVTGENDISRGRILAACAIGISPVSMNTL